MKNLLSAIFIISGCILCVSLHAQSDISRATSWYNRANYNPASIAKPNYLYLFTNFRQQWIGIEGAPQILNIQVSQYIHQYRSAVGFSMISDKIGVSRVYNPMANYAYRLAKKQEWSLSFGLSAGVFSRFIDGTLYEADTNSDPSITYDKETKTQPDFNAGIEFQNINWIFGISSTHLNSIGKNTATYFNTNHRYGYLVFKSKKPQLFNYNIGMQVVNRQNLTYLEGNASIRLKRPTGLVDETREMFDLGFSVRTTRQLDILFSINILPNARIGYVYEQSFRKGYYMNSTHEIALEWRIPSKTANDNTVCEKFQSWYH